MRPLGIAPTVNQLTSQYTTDFLKTLAERCNVYTGTVNPTASQIPNKQWIVFKNTTNGEVRLWTNDNGVLKNVLLNTNTKVPAFSAYKSANQTITTGLDTKVTFDVVDFDTVGGFSSSRWTPGVAGIYDVSFVVSNTDGGTSSSGVYADLWKNGSTFVRGTQFNDIQASITGSNLSVKVQLTATDYLEVYTFIIGAAPKTLGGTPPRLTHFSGCLLCPL